MEATAAIQDERPRRRREEREDPLRALFKFMSITMLSLFLGMAVVQVGLGQHQPTDPTGRQLEELQRQVGHRRAANW